MGNVKKGAVNKSKKVAAMAKKDESALKKKLQDENARLRAKIAFLKAHTGKKNGPGTGWKRWMKQAQGKKAGDDWTPQAGTDAAKRVKRAARNAMNALVKKSHANKKIKAVKKHAVKKMLNTIKDASKKVAKIAGKPKSLKKVKSAVAKVKKSINGKLLAVNSANEAKSKYFDALKAQKVYAEKAKAEVLKAKREAAMALMRKKVM